MTIQVASQLKIGLQVSRIIAYIFSYKIHVDDNMLCIIQTGDSDIMEKKCGLSLTQNNSV
jgi:hypothetical protein